MNAENDFRDALVTIKRLCCGQDMCEDCEHRKYCKVMSHPVPEEWEIPDEN